MTETARIPEYEGFDWSGGNAEKNWAGHHVTPLEAEQVFFDLPLITGTDSAHSEKERRFYALGRTDEGRRLFIVFTLRGRRLRVISARDMSRRERKVYRP
jgi:uncharacterized DUF497 family protein